MHEEFIGNYGHNVSGLLANHSAEHNWMHQFKEL